MRRYKVIDDSGQAIRIFPSRSEAKRFLQDDWSIVIMVAPNKYQQALERVGEAIF